MAEQKYSGIKMEDVANVLRKNEFDVEVKMSDTHDKVTLVVKMGINKSKKYHFLFPV